MWPWRHEERPILTSCIVEIIKFSQLANSENQQILAQYTYTFILIYQKMSIRK